MDYNTSPSRPIIVNEMTNQKIIIKKIGKLLAIYGVQIWLILFVANVGFITFIRFKASAQACLTQSQIDADSRCLYILDGKIYSKGNKGNPHHGHACGSDVTSVIPSFHTSDANSYLLPTYVGPLCVNVATPVPTAQPTQPPTAAPTSAPTAAPTSAPTAAPTQPPNNATQNPSATKSPSPVPTKSPSPKPTSTNIATNITPEPTQSPNNPTPTDTSVTTKPEPTPPDVGNFGSKTKITAAVNVTLPVSSPEPQPVYTPNPAPIGPYYLYYWSTVFSYISFVILLGIGVYWLIQKIKARAAELESIKNISTPASK